ncbi:MAG TPA: superoxide dismutase [Candidatus Hydrogenedentes bacterium]|nr:superoxide dismutase [Candidatus Hydrogenedentota bacterium]
MAIVLPSLPYAMNALEPVISAETIEFHHGKHHQAYVTNLNKLIDGTSDADKPLEAIVLASEGAVFNNAAQVWNHTFYWDGLSPEVTAPESALAEAIARDFGSLAALQDQLANTATTQFGSGWAWLVLDAGTLKVTKTSNADLPTKHGQTALWTIDVWEHAYYIDYRNARPKYVEAVLANLVNWRFVSENYARALTT